MPRFNADILGRLQEVTPDDLAGALAAIREDAAALADQPPTRENVAALRELANARQALAAEQTERANLAAEQTATLADINAGDEPDGEAGDGDQTDEPREPNQPGLEVQDAVNESATSDTADTADAAAQRASGDDGSAGDGVQASGRPARREMGTAGMRPRSNTRAIPRIVLQTHLSTGQPHSPAPDTADREALARAFYDAVRTPSVRGRQPVATLVAQYPEERHLRRNVGALHNIELVERAVDDARSRTALQNLEHQVTLRSGPDGLNALTAAGLCAPLQTLYDIRTVGDQDRPVRDALTRFGADRGGIQYRPAIDSVSQTGGIGVWTVDDDEDLTPTPKSCAEIACPGIATAEVEAIYQCLRFSNMSTRFDPEYYDAVLESQRIAHARFAENRLIGQLTTASKDVTSPQVLGATRDILATLDHVVAYYRNVHRFNGNTPFRWIAPIWALNLMRADITRQMVGDGLQALAVTDAQLAQWLAARNVNVTWHLDGIDPADITVPDPDVVVPAQFYTSIVEGNAVPGFPNAISSLLFAEGDWLYLDGGTLDLGVVRDTTVNALNRFEVFSEEFGFPAFRGIESLHLVMAVNPTGQSAATKDTSAIAD